MTILPESIVVASEEAFSLMVPEGELVEAISFDHVPDNFPNESLRGLHLRSATVTAHKMGAVRVMYHHAQNPKSTVKLVRGGNDGH